MAKRPDLEHVKWVRSKGKDYAYFNTGKKNAKGNPIRLALGHPASPGFFDRYAAMVAGRTKRLQSAYTIADLADDYQRSIFFAQRSKGTQGAYRKAIKRIVEHLGDHPVDDLDREDLLLVLNNEMAGPGAYNIFVAVLGILYRFARQNGKTQLEPTKDIPKMDLGEHRAWPEHVVEAGLESAHDRTRLAVHLLYFTGQRIGDVCKMRWSDIRGDAVFVTQQKTAKKLRIPLANELAAELARTPKRGLTIITNEKGGPMLPDVIRRELKAHGRTFGLEIVPHGLRKNAVISLLHAGCTVAETAAITGQTYKIVEHYAREVDQEKLGSAAILKLENKRATGKRSGKSAGKASDFNRGR